MPSEYPAAYLIFLKIVSHECTKNTHDRLQPENTLWYKKFV